MNKSVYRFTLDIHKTGSQVMLTTKKGSTGRQLKISLAEGFYPYEIADDCYAVFRARKADGTMLYNDCVIEENLIIYNFTDQTVSANGMMDCEITLYASDGTQITSPSFNILVDETTQKDDDIESSDEFGALTDIIGKLGNIGNLVKNAAEEAVQAAILNGGIVPGPGGNLGNIEKRCVNVTFSESGWLGENGVYGQPFYVYGITDSSQVNIALDVEKYQELSNEGVTLLTKNSNGNVTLYAIGNKPSKDFPAQLMIEEVDADEEITEIYGYVVSTGRGSGGTSGVGIDRIEQTLKSTENGGINEVTVYLTNGESYTFEVNNGSRGNDGNGIESAVMNPDYTLTLTFSEGGTYTTPSLRGPTGMTGEAGADGKDGPTLEEVVARLTLDSDEWEFTLANGTKVIKKVVLV